jgi:hypothetical protein
MPERIYAEIATGDKKARPVRLMTAETRTITGEEKFSTAVLLEVAFPQVLKVANALAEEGGTLSEIRDRIHNQAPSEEIVLLCEEMLLRAGFAALEEQKVLPTPALGKLLSALESFCLDEASALWETYKPYQLVCETLKERGRVKLSASLPLLVKRLGRRPSREASDRLWRIPVYLAQAWTLGGELRDGSNRPDRKLIMDELLTLFRRLAKDGLCLLSDILPELCGNLRISPWAAGREIQSLVEDGSLSEVSFQPSAGKKIATRDQVVYSKDGEIKTASVALDRLEIGGRPVFALVRAK